MDAPNPIYSSVDGVLFDKSQTTLVEYPCGLDDGSYTIPNSVTGIGDSAFSGCYSLTNVTIGTNVTSIGDSAFYGCSSLTSVTIGNSVANIGDLAFSGCESLTTVTIGTNVTSIGDSAFYGCALTSITIPNSVTNIGNGAFYLCESLTSVTIGNGVTSIGGYAFSYCFSLTSITIPNSVTNIGGGAFSNCALTNVTIPDSVTSIGDSAFADCSLLTSVYFAGNAPTLGGTHVFDGDNNMTAYYLPGTTGWGTTFGGCGTALWFLPNPLILIDSPSFGVKANGFGFIISWATNLPVVVEASTSLANPTWYPLATNTLTSGSAYFTDPQWTNYPSRFYRLRSP